jgi:tetratricopeptide (TPR) repeat protein
MSLHAAQSEHEPAGRRLPPSDTELRKQLDSALRDVDRNENDNRAWQEVGRVRALLRLDNEAVTAFERALALDSRLEHPSYWLALAIAGTRSGRFDLALRSFEVLTEQSFGERSFREEPAFWIFKSMALENLGRGDEAEAALREAVSLEANPGNRVAIAYALGMLGRYDEALRHDEQAIRENDGNAHAWANKGMHLAQQGLEADAVDAFENALKRAPDDGTILRNYGVALGELGQFRKARSKLEEAVARRPDDVAALRSLGFVFTNLGDHCRALKYDARAVEFAPYHPVAWRSKGVDLFHLGRYEEALYAFDQATTRAPGRPEMWQAKGSALWKLGQYAEAAEEFEHATSLEGAPTEAWLGLGASLEALERRTEALKALRTAVGLAPERCELWAMLGRTYRELGNAQAAEHAYRRGFDLKPSVEMASGVVDALAAQGQEDIALEFLEKKLPHDSDEAMQAYLRGVLLARLGREGEAMGDFRRAARRWRLDDVRNARATAVAGAVDAFDEPGRGVASWSEHWFGRGRSPTTRVLGAVLLLGLLAALAVPFLAADDLAALKYGAGWAAITLPVTVFVLLLALPAVQSIKAGGGSFEITTIVVPERDRLALALPSEVQIQKIADLPSLDAFALGMADQVQAFLEGGEAEFQARRAAQREAAS